MSTIPAKLDDRVCRSPDKIGYRQFDATRRIWQAYSWRTIGELVGRWRAGFVASGLCAGDRVAILDQNSVNWVCFDHAALGLGLVTVPLNRSDGPETWIDELSETGTRFLFVGSIEDWRTLSNSREKCAALKWVVCNFDTGGNRVGMVHLQDWLPARTVPASEAVHADSLATITYTSGTTGRPKGVMLSHRNILTATNATLRRNPGFPEDVFVSFLPMAHIFERTTEYYLAIECGGETVFARSVADLPEDFATFRPTIIMGVPRIYERVWQSLVSAAQKNPLGRWLLNRAVVLGPPDHGENVLIRGQRWLIARLITKKLMDRFGGRLRLAVCGGAPLSPELAMALRAVGLPILEGYGLAEAAGPVSGDSFDDYVPGTVGQPLEGTQVRISENREILIRSESVMSGYWKRPTETNEVLDPEGWLHTGDIGELREGRLRLHGRVRDLIVLSTGEKLAPSDIESRIVLDPLFSQAMVIGDNRPIVAALVVLDAGQWRKFATDKGFDPLQPNALRSEEALLSRIGAACNGVPRYAQIRHLWASLDPWTVENGLLTVTLKVRRAAVAKRYRQESENLFAQHL